MTDNLNEKPGLPYPELEQELEARFESERISALCDEFLEKGTGVDLREMINGREFVVAYIDANSPYSDIGRSVETEVFARAFHMSLGEVDKDYGKYDAKSIFATVIDVSADTPRPAGVLRIIEHDPELGFKDVNDLLVDDPENPWIEEIKNNYFEPGEAYSPDEAWRRLSEKAGVNLDLDESLDIATHASGEAYRGAHGSLDGVSMLFFHACVRYSLATGKKNLLAIFDLPPLANLQQFGDPFDTYDGLEAHPYGGPFPTMPAYCVLERGFKRIEDKDPAVLAVMRDGALLKEMALLPNEYLPEVYSDQAVGLAEV